MRVLVPLKTLFRRVNFMTRTTYITLCVALHVAIKGQVIRENVSAFWALCPATVFLVTSKIVIPFEILATHAASVLISRNHVTILLLTSTLTLSVPFFSGFIWQLFP